jgi:Carboxypeptidase regulatory-like domain
MAYALSAGAATVWLLLGLLIVLSLRESRGGASNATWEKHRAEIRKLPEDLYHHDRFRAIRGRVTGPEGKPVAGALVRCVRVESLVDLAKTGAPRAAAWMIPVEAQTTTGSDGTYEFPHLSVGARTFFYSSSGTDLAPAVRDLVVVQDGLGANLDVALEPPAALRVKFAPVPVRSVIFSTPGKSRKPSRHCRPGSSWFHTVGGQRFQRLA